MNPVYHVQSFNQHNVTIIVQWGYEHRRAHNYTIAGTHFLTTSTETNEIKITLPYNELQTINVTANNCIGSSSAALVTFFERKLSTNYAATQLVNIFLLIPIVSGEWVLNRS